MYNITIILFIHDLVVIINNCHPLICLIMRMIICSITIILIIIIISHMIIAMLVIVIIVIIITIMAPGRQTPRTPAQINLSPTSFEGSTITTLPLASHKCQL